MTVDDILDALYLQAKDEVGLTKLRDIILTDESINCLSFGGKDIKPIEFIKVVRCKDCKHFKPIEGERLCGAWEEIFYNPVEENGYCYKGERKESEE